MNSSFRNPANPMQEQALDRCCIALEAEIARQNRVLELCHEQSRAARLRDVDALEAANRDLANSMKEVLRAEAERMAAVMDAARGLELAPENLQLSRIISRAPEPWRARLLDIQRRLKTVVTVTQRVVEANGRYLRDGARTAERLLAEVIGDTAQGTNAYDRGGRAPGARVGANALLNVAG